jgi:4-amino-4-deoxy-L-arabinose transferase-like glycosyltransferase
MIVRGVNQTYAKTQPRTDASRREVTTVPVFGCIGGQRRRPTQTPLTLPVSQFVDGRLSRSGLTAAALRHPIAVCASLSAVIRLGLLLFVHPLPTWDGAIYSLLAERLAAGSGLVHWATADRPTAFYPVGYPALVGALLRVGLTPAWAAPLINVIAATASAALISWAAKTLAGQRAALFCGVVYALLPGSILWSIAPMTETVTGTLTLMLLCLTLKHQHAPQPSRSRTQSAIWATKYGLVCAIASMVRPQSLLLAPLGAVCRRPRSATNVWLTLAVLCTIMSALWLLPWTARNCVRLDHCALVSTNGGSNLYIGTLTHPNGGFVSLESQPDCVAIQGEVARERCYTQTALRRIAANPVGWLAKFPRKIARTFAIEWAPASYLQSATHSQNRGLWLAVGVLCTALWWALVVGAVAGARALLRVRPASDELAATAVRFTAGATALIALTHGIFISDDRYHFPLIQLLCVLLAGLARAEGVRS